MNHIFDFQQTFSIKGVVSKLRVSMAKKQQNEIKIECVGGLLFFSFDFFGSRNKPGGMREALSFSTRRSVNGNESLCLVPGLFHPFL